MKSNVVEPSVPPEEQEGRRAARPSVEGKGRPQRGTAGHALPLFKRLRYLFVHTSLAWRYIALEKSSQSQVWQQLLLPVLGISLTLAFVGGLIAHYAGVGYDMRVGTSLSSSLLLVAMLALGIWGIAKLTVWWAPLIAKTDIPPSRRRSFQWLAHGAVPVLLSMFVAFIPGAVWFSAIGLAWMLWLLWQGMPALIAIPPRKRLPVFLATVLACLAWAAVTVGIMKTALPDRLIWQSTNVAPDSQSKPVDEVASQATGDSGGVVAGAAVNQPISGGAVGDLVPDEAEVAMGDEADPLSEQLDPAMADLSKRLSQMLPPKLLQLPRGEQGAQTISIEEALGVVVSGVYQLNQQEIAVNLIYMGPDPRSEVPGAWANETMSRETDERIQRVYAEGGRYISESAWKDGSSAGLKVILGNGLMLDLDARHVSLEQLRLALAELQVDVLEKLEVR